MLVLAVKSYTVLMPHIQCFIQCSVHYLLPVAHIQCFIHCRFPLRVYNVLFTVALRCIEGLVGETTPNHTGQRAVDSLTSVSRRRG